MPSPMPLRREAVKRVAGNLFKELGATDSKRLSDLIPLIDEKHHTIQFSQALDALFPDKNERDQLTALRQFRARLADRAAEAGISLTLEVDTHLRNAPAERNCWFIGDDLTEQAVAELANAPMIDLQRIPQAGADLVAMEAGKPVIHYFVSYAHRDERWVKKLFHYLDDFFSTSPYRFKRWLDKDNILPGDNWRQEIQQALDQCQFGLLLASPSFFASEFITEQELPLFISTDSDPAQQQKRGIPVMLRRILFNGHMDLKGLQDKQIFTDGRGKAFADNLSDVNRERFVLELFQKIIEVVQKRLPPTPPGGGSLKLAAHRYAEQMAAKHNEQCFVPSEGYEHSLDKLSEQNLEHQQKQREDVLTYLDNWLKNPEAAKYCALLGEFGMGKTTTCIAFARNLLEQRKTDRNIPLPIYLDLRAAGELAQRNEFTLTEILRVIVKNTWQSGRYENELTPEEIIALVRENGALAIFDGLDEILVHLSVKDGQRFTREIFRILPPAFIRQDKKGNVQETAQPKRNTGRVLITCRSHYFRTVRDQISHFTTEGRDGIQASDYRAFLLLPFSEDQIREYIQRALPERDPDELMELIGGIHNLTEVAERPLMLELISKEIAQIERWKAEGKVVTGVTLYRHMVQSALERDTGKHSLTPDHKFLLMEYAAATLWRGAKRVWTATDMEQWLMDFFATHPHIKEHYEGVSRELLKIDLRAATFLVGEGTGSFRFAHSSLQEFFLAGYLLRALLENRPQDWALPAVSRETLDFLGQLLLEKQGEAAPALKTLREMRATYRAQASEMVFAYGLLAQKTVASPTAYPGVALAGFNLAGADLRFLQEISGTPGHTLNLREINLSNTRLEGLVVQHANLDGANLSGACLDRSEWHSISAQGANFSLSSLVGTQFSTAQMQGAEFARAQLHRSKWLSCNLEHLTGLEASHPQAYFAACQPQKYWTKTPAHATLRHLDGYLGPVYHCMLSADGQRIVSASEDQTLRVWESASGECVAVLRGHEGAVSHCVVSADGERIVSASWDHTLRVWDSASGECVAVLRGHEAGVSHCVVSADGERIVSASWDHTLRVWESASGECVAVLRGHEGAVSHCVVSADGERIVSASWDHTLRVWESASGECVAVLRGHEAGVSHCVVSADGERIVSASFDKTLRVWDSTSGECVAVLRGHEAGVNHCVVSADGERIVSASFDNTLRVWESASGECVAVLRGHEAGVNHCVVSADGERIVSVSEDQTLRVWESASGECVAVLRGHEGAVSHCVVSADGERIVSASFDNTLRVWDSTSGECVAVLRGHEAGVSHCVVSADGERIVSASWDHTLRVWESASGECVAVLRGHEGAVSHCVVSADGQRIVSASFDNTLRVWDSASGECVAVLRGHEAGVSHCVVSADGERIVSASFDKTLRVWESGSGECVAVLRGHEAGVTHCVVSADGERIVSASWDHTLRVWESGSGECVAVLRGHEAGVSHCVVSADGERIVSASFDKTLRVWDSTSGECVAVLRGHEAGVTHCVVSADGERIVSASFDKTLRVWDSTSGECVAVLRGHEAGVTHCVVSADGERIVSASWDHTLRVWESGSGECVAVLRGHEAAVTHCVVSADGRRIVSTSNDGSLRVWDDVIGEGESGKIKFETTWMAQHWESNEAASFSGNFERVIEASANAWRYLGWQGINPATGKMDVFPAEVFGPLPLAKPVVTPLLS